MSQFGVYTRENTRLWLISKLGAARLVASPEKIDDLVAILVNSPVEEWDDIFDKNTVFMKLKRIEDVYSPYSDRIEKISNTISFVLMLVALLSTFLSVMNLASVRGVYFPSLAEVLDWLLEVSPYIITPVGVMGALTLFALRGYMPKVYGSLEIVVGIWTVGSTASAVTLDQIPSLIPFLGGVYVIIRGLDNYAKALDPTSPLGRLFGRLFNNPASRGTQTQLKP